MFSGVEVRLLGELRPWRSRPLTPWSSQVLSRSVKAARCAWAHYPAAAVWLLLRTDANQACLRRNEWKHPQTWIFPVGPVNFKHLKCLALLHLQISGFQTAICPLRPLRGSFFVLTGLMWWSCFSVSEGTEAADWFLLMVWSLWASLIMPWKQLIHFLQSISRVSRPALLENPESESPSVCRLLKKLPSELLSDNSADSVFCVTHLTMFEHPTGHYTQLHHIGVDLTRGYFETWKYIQSWTPLSMREKVFLVAWVSWPFIKCFSHSDSALSFQRIDFWFMAAKWISKTVTQEM